MISPDSIKCPESKYQSYGLIIDKYQPHNLPSLILNNLYFLSEQHWCAPTETREVAYKYRLEFEIL
jgi:hypothetical protein